MEEKKKFWQYPGEVEGFGQAFVVSEEQKLDWADLFFMVTQPVHLRKPHLFPQLPLPFRLSLLSLSILCCGELICRPFSVEVNCFESLASINFKLKTSQTSI